MDSTLVRLALERGWIRPDQAGTPLDKLLSPQQIEELRASRTFADKLLDGGLALVEEAPKNFGRYQIKRVLGAGASGQVYLTFDPVLGRDVAVKILERGLAEHFERFKREMGILAALRHPNIVAIHDAGSHEGRPYYAMEYVGEKTLRDLPRDGALRAIEDVALACQAAHEKGIVHRDLKPANILLGDRPVVADFGVARVQNEPLTATGETLGTPHYMSPEQARGEPVDARSDVYSLGVMLYEILTKKLPFEGTNLFDVLKKIEEVEPKTPDAPRDLRIITQKAMAKEPSRRYQSAREFADDLKAWREGRPIQARSIRPWERLARFLRRKPAYAVIAILAVVAFIAANAAMTRAKITRNERIVAEEWQRIQAWSTNLYKAPREISYEELEKSVDRLNGIQHAQAFYAKARAYIYMGRTNEAESALNEAIRLRPAGELYFERARLQWEDLVNEAFAKREPTGDRFKSDLRAALQAGIADPWYREFAQATLDIVEKGEKVIPDALQRLEKLSQSREKPAEEIDKALGDIYLLMKKPDQAIEKYEKAKADRQCYIQAYNGLALAWLSKENAAKAIKACSKGIDLNPRYEPSYFLFVHICREALKASPEDLLRVFRGEGEKLLKQGLAILRSGPRTPPIMTAQGHACIITAFGMMGVGDDPEPMFQEAFRVLARDPLGLGIAHAVRLLHKKKSPEDDAKARECLEPLKTADAYRWLGNVHYLSERFPEAAKAWRQSLALDDSKREELEKAIADAERLR